MRRDHTGQRPLPPVSRNSGEPCSTIHSTGGQRTVCHCSTRAIARSDRDVLISAADICHKGTNGFGQCHIARHARHFVRQQALPSAHSGREQTPGSRQRARWRPCYLSIRSRRSTAALLRRFTFCVGSSRLASGRLGPCAASRPARTLGDKPE